MPPRTFTVAQIAAQMLVKPHRVLGWIHAGALIAVDLNAGTGKPSWRVRADDLDAFLAARATKSPTPSKSRSRSRGEVIPFF